MLKCLNVEILGQVPQAVHVHQCGAAFEFQMLSAGVISLGTESR